MCLLTIIKIEEMQGSQNNKPDRKIQQTCQIDEFHICNNSLCSNTDNPLKRFFTKNHSLPVKTLTSLQTGNNWKVPNILQHENNVNKQSQNSNDQIHFEFYPQNSGISESQAPQINTSFLNSSLHEPFSIQKQRFQTYYQLMEVIGEGAYGKVFRSICRNTKKQRAVKLMKTKYLKNFNAQKFLQEIKLISAIRHPSIIKIYSVFKNQNTYYVVMEYCKGGSLIEKIEEIRKRPQEFISNIMKQIIQALAFMHSQGIIHRDIKLENVAILNPITADSQFAQIKIIDFETAVLYQPKKFSNYPISGTLQYLAPQVLNMKLTNKSDIWSSAVLMIILLTKMSPFAGLSVEETKHNILERDIRFGEGIFKNISQTALQLLKLMLEKNFRKRISAAQALWHPWFYPSS